MNLERQSALTTMALALVLVLAVVPASGAEHRGDTLAAVSALGDQVAWVPNGGATRLALSVSGPGVDFAQRFDGEAPVFSLFDDRGNTLSDGSYTWELREEMAPVNDSVRDPENGRDSAAHDSDRRVESVRRTQWGTFTVVNGAVVESSLVEEQAPRPNKS
jgi:hypothetical protein